MELVAEMAVYSVGGAVRRKPTITTNHNHHHRRPLSQWRSANTLPARAAFPRLPSQVGYGHPQTLSDVGLKLAPGIRGDAIHLKPTFMVFPPTVLDRIRQARP